MVKQNAKISNAARAFSQKVPLGSAVKDMTVVDGRPLTILWKRTAATAPE